MIITILFFQFIDVYDVYVSFRLHSLEASCDTLPTSLVLAKEEEKDNFKTVLGHAKITPIPSIPDSGFIETGN